ncbi:M15 family metallopeptidase [Bradyrhizobium sp. UFLA03-84]|uniref:M15 family metallopeptidase n=1 Tax=Bradyrhizobium sp. UFLA03-84 TaxID=418599 RepID=UPI00130472C8|nr:M15 family metallopeptidase [Bradyrhizobium sp. UFLA03-84]
MDQEEDAGRKAANQQLASLLLGGSGAMPAQVAAATPAIAGSPGPTVPNDANAIPGTAGMDQRLADRTQDFIQDNPGTSLSSGVRSRDDQAALYADRANNPNPVAPPGTSLHERGMAADIGGMTPQQRAMLPQYGLAQPVANDPVHVQLAASSDEAALPAAAQPTQGALPTAEAVAGQPQRMAQNPNTMAAYQILQNPYASAAQKQVASAILSASLKPREQHSQVTDSAGNIWDVNQMTGQRTLSLKKDPSFSAPFKDEDGNLVQKDATGKISVLSAADKTPNSVSEYKYYTDNFVPTPENPKPMDYATFSTAKARAGATNISNSVDLNSGQTYDKQLAEGLGKAHASLANGVEDAQTRARDIAAMQGAIDAIQKNGGTTGGMAPQARLELQKSINAGASALGISKPFSEADLSDQEFLTKFNRSMAGAQAKNAVGSRVTNFEMSNFLKANPGLDMTITGNQRLLGIQAQIEQRNIAVGNAIRDATAEAISQGKKVDPRTVEGIIRKYDEDHHISDPSTGQDLTQSYALPEFQKTGQGTNAGLAGRHEENMSKVRRYDPETGTLK